MLLQVENITCRYGSVTALRNASLVVNEGEAVCVLGSNGAGKSTLLQAIMGLLPPVEGEIRVRDKSVGGSSPSVVVGAGVTLVAEGRKIFPALSVADNLLLGGYVNRGERSRVKARIEQMYETFPVLKERSNQNAGLLSGGQQQMLAIAQALMAEPSLLLLDEPSLGLAPSMVETVLETIRQLHVSGIAILIVEQMVQQALDLCDRGYVMQTGRIVRAGTTDDLRSDPVVREAYLGLVD